LFSNNNCVVVIVADAYTSVPTTIIPDNIIVDNLDYLRFNWTLASNATKVKAIQPPIKYAVYSMSLKHGDKDTAKQRFINDFQQRKQCKSVFTVQQSVADRYVASEIESG
jgi:hypothetical protein